MERMVVMSKNFEITLSPGDIWLPQGTIQTILNKNDENVPEDKKIEEKDCVCHIWHEVTLFRSTITECKKCGKLRDE